ncbi:zinc-binding dehydrogenase, partial [Lysobacter sp. 2RAB21]
MAHQLNIHGVSLGSLQVLREYLDVVEAHRIRPVVGARFSFEDGARAIASIAEQRQVGKPVVMFD